jgi:hypothetical protein
MNGIFVEFHSKKELNYVQKVLRRKGYNLAEYIIGNFEWDDMPECISTSARPGRICTHCDWNDRCEDTRFKQEPEHP